MASNHKNAFPFFVANQILRSSTLNDYFAFLDEQTRLSRVHLWGTGIVEGLDFSFKDGVLVIEPGVAVNQQGWLVQVPERVEYNYGAEVPYASADFKDDELKKLASQGGSHVSMICFRDKEDAMHSGLGQPFRLSERVLDGFVVALAYGKRPEYDSLCSHDICDVNTGAQILEAWPVLIPKNDIDCLFQRLKPLAWAISPQKEPAFECYHGVQGAFNSLMSSAASSYVPVFKKGVDELSKEFSQYSQPALQQLLPDWERFRDEFIFAIRKAMSGVSPECKDFLILFFKDIVMALNEFVEEFNAFADKYPFIPCSIPSDMLVYLGQVGGREMEGRDVYRSVFKNAIDEEYARDRKRLAAMFGRIMVLAESVVTEKDIEWFSKQPFRLERIQAGARLSSRPVPCYYDTEKADFFSYWNADNHGLDTRALEGRVQHSSFSMCDDGFLFFPSGYEGKDLPAVKNELDSLNRDMRFGLDVVEGRIGLGGPLSSEQVSTLRAILAAISRTETPVSFFAKIQDQCSGGASKLASTLKGVFDAQFIQSLSEKKLLSEESYRAIYDLADLKKSDVVDLATKVWNSLSEKDKKTGSANSFSTAFEQMILAWKFNFIETDEGVSPDEIGKAVSLAPIKRGCRVFLFTAGEPPKVWSYSVLYRNESALAAKAPTGMVLFWLRTKEAENGDYASDFPDTINPYEDGRWDISKNNEIVLYPYLLDGTFAKRYEMPKDNISCDISAPDILQYSIRVEKGVPAVVLKMTQNGTAWVTLQIKDDKDVLLYHKTKTIVVNNPLWKVVPLTGISVNQTVLVHYMGEAPKQLVAKPIPEDATGVDKLEWKSTKPKVATVGKTGVVTGVSAGTAEAVVECPAYPSVSKSVAVHVYMLDFRMKTTSGYTDLKKNQTVRPFQDGKWDIAYNQMIVCPHMFDGTRYQEFVPDSRTSDTFRVGCVIEDEKILEYEQFLTGPEGRTPAIRLKMKKTGSTPVALTLYKGKEQLLNLRFKVNVVNEDWDKVPVESIKFVGNVPKQLYMGQTLALECNFTPETATDKTVTWNSDSPSIAEVFGETRTVDGKKVEVGIVTPRSCGTVEITAKTRDGGKTVKATLAVKSLLFQLEKEDKKKGKLRIPIEKSVAKKDGFSGTNFTVYAFEFDGKVKRQLTSAEIQIVQDPEERAEGGPKVNTKTGDKAVISWPDHNAPLKTVTLLIKDKSGKETFYTQSFELLV